MYINFDNFKKSNLSFSQVFTLLAIRQQSYDNIVIDDLEVLVERKIVQFIKGDKNQAKHQRARLSKNGKQLFESLSEAECEEQDKIVFDWLKNFYIKNNKEVGNGAKTIRHIRDFRIKSGIEKNNLIELCKAFLADDENMQWNHKLEFAFYKAPTAFETRFKLEESRLYKYYEKRKEYFDKKFNTL